MTAESAAYADDVASDLASTPSPVGTSANTPSSSFASDKENNQSLSAHPSSAEKRKQQARSGLTMDLTPNKRRRVSRHASRPSTGQATREQRLLRGNDTNYYDPNQDPEERRQVRKGLRELAANLNDSRAEFLQTESHGIRNTVEKANEIFKGVKQTSDATIDSRLLVSAVDLSYKRTAHAVLGDAAEGTIDLDEFVSKCISFMREGAVADDVPSASQLNASTQRRRRHDSRRSQAAAEEGDEGEDVLNWDFLGSRACFPHNRRPPLPGFLLGPLSVQKRVRQAPQGRARQERADPSRAVQPQELKNSDLKNQETESLTEMCQNIRGILQRTAHESERLVNEELSQMDDVQPEQVAEVMDKYGISDNGGISLFRFCVNPRSFGQTIENLFYVSFLVRDDLAGLALDSNELPTLLVSEPALPSDAQRKGHKRHQAIFSLDFETWEDIIKTFDIKSSIIPHRDETEVQQAEGTWQQGWND